MGVTDEVDSAASDGDEMDDGVIFGSSFVANLTSEITVNASAPGFIDAWVDWNADGDWNDANEQILTRSEISTGANLFVVRAPDAIPLGSTYARFRLSSAGDLEPTGLAADGEVEDYEVMVGINPWQNPGDPLDVNGQDGPSPLDALLIINELNDFTYADSDDGRLPIPSPIPDSPPPFLDVSGDGFVSPLDALLVINSLSSASPVAAPLGARAEMDDSDSIVVSQAMTVELRPASRVRDAMWATLDRRTASDDDTLQLPLAAEHPYQHQYYRPVTNRLVTNRLVTNRPATESTKTTSQETWSGLVEEVFDDTLSPWGLDL
jgi:hypothetical protein